jgi:FMN phosphatase YigB (HAD superfamily)
LKETVLRETVSVLDGTHPRLRLGDFVRGLPGDTDFDSMRLPPNTPTGELPDGWTYLGDGWTVVYYLTRAAGIERQTYIDAFHASRYAMSAGELDHEPSQRLVSVLTDLKQLGVRLIMQTNSSDDSGWPTLRYLGLDSLFDDYVFTAGKPAGMATLFGQLRERYGIDPSGVVSVGDHPWNDVAAARELGGRSLLISPFSGLSEIGFEPRIRTVTELADTLAALATATRGRVSTYTPN